MECYDTEPGKESMTLVSGRWASAGTECKQTKQEEPLIKHAVAQSGEG